MKKMKLYEQLSKEIGSPAEIRAYYLYYSVYGTVQEKKQAPLEMVKNKRAFFADVIRQQRGHVAQEWYANLNESVRIFAKLCATA